MGCAQLTPGSDAHLVQGPDHFAGDELKTNLVKPKDESSEESSSATNSMTGQEATADSGVNHFVSSDEAQKNCEHWMARMPSGSSQLSSAELCNNVQVLEGCRSLEGEPIFHFEKKARRSDPEKILTFALIHGDELPSGAVAKAWMDRLTQIEPRNQWRIVPVLNPDGTKKKSRLNSRGVDLNRNFPSADWNESAIKAWKEKTKSDPRRYPGPEAASEPETLCAMNHIDDFDPDLIISIHTPYGVLDFDGPKMGFPKVNKLPWVSLGTFPGSLGRYMWTDRQRPVLTIELNHNLNEALDGFDRLQDISGQVALMLKNQKRERALRSKTSQVEEHD